MFATSTSLIAGGSNVDTASVWPSAETAPAMIPAPTSASVPGRAVSVCDGVVGLQGVVPVLQVCRLGVAGDGEREEAGRVVVRRQLGKELTGRHVPDGGPSHRLRP